MNEEQIVEAVKAGFSGFNKAEVIYYPRTPTTRFSEIIIYVWHQGEKAGARIELTPHFNLQQIPHAAAGLMHVISNKSLEKFSSSIESPPQT